MKIPQGKYCLQPFEKYLELKQVMKSFYVEQLNFSSSCVFIFDSLSCNNFLPTNLVIKENVYRLLFILFKPFSIIDIFMTHIQKSFTGSRYYLYRFSR